MNGNTPNVHKPRSSSRRGGLYLALRRLFSRGGRSDMAVSSSVELLQPKESNSPRGTINPGQADEQLSAAHPTLTAPAAAMEIAGDVCRIEDSPFRILKVCVFSFVCEWFCVMLKCFC